MSVMAREFRPVVRDQVFLLPPDVREWLPADHLVWFILDTLETMDLSVFEACRRRGGVGAAGYDPRMLLGLLIYAYCRGVRSSRQIERLCGTDVAFRVLCAQDVPDHCTLARFRADCQAAFASLFTRVLLIAGHAGLARFGTVAIDGTKIAANASIDANRGAEWLAGEVDRMLIEADHVDAVEDRAGERGHQAGEGDRVPAGLVDRQDRQARILAALQEVTKQTQQQAEAEKAKEETARRRRERAEAGEPVIGRIPAGPHRLAEAQAHLEREIARQQAKLARRAAIIAAGKKPIGAAPVAVDEHSSVIRSRRAVEAALAAEAVVATDEATAPSRPGGNGLPGTVANITDPGSRLMPTRRGFLQGYNAQVAVTSDQMIAAVQVSQSPNDMAALAPMMAAAQAAAQRLHEQTGRDEHTIGIVLADAGYCSDANLAAPGPDRLIATGKSRHQLKTAREHPTSGEPPPGSTPRQAMQHRLRTTEGMTLYKRRGATVEPGIGNLKKIIDQFSRRGREAAASELHLAAAAFNLMKIHRAAPTA
jgi:transposase